MRFQEEYAIILDFLPEGKPTDIKKEPIAQAVGVKYFILLELVPKRNIYLEPLEKVYIGRGFREKIEYIKKRIKYDELTSLAKDTLEEAVGKIIEEDEKRFVNFFNNAKPINVRIHQLELLPGIGKRLLHEILEERKKKPFESFKDIKERVKSIPDPKKIILERILMEIKGEERSGKLKWRLFVAP